VARPPRPSSPPTISGSEGIPYSLPLSPVVPQRENISGHSFSDRSISASMQRRNFSSSPRTELNTYGRWLPRPWSKRGSLFATVTRDATLAYQGFGRGLDREVIARVNAFATGNLYPHLTLLFDVEVTLGLSRVTSRSAPKDRLEREEQAFHERVRRGYLALAAAEPNRIQVIDASQAIEAIQLQVRSILDPFIAERCRGSVSTDLRP